MTQDKAPHFWLRAESRANEARTPLTPEGAAALIAQGVQVTVESSPSRIIPNAEYSQAGCTMAPAQSWPDAPRDAVILGLKELPPGDAPLIHRHIMFCHSFKEQPVAQSFLNRFTQGGGALLDLEYLVDDQGRRLVAFGYWAGFAGAAMALHCWLAQQRGQIAPPAQTQPSAGAMIAQLRAQLAGQAAPGALIIGALGRTGRGAAALLSAVQSPITAWDIAETARGGITREILRHEIFLNCILAGPDTPVFLPKDTRLDAPRALRVIADIACDPTSPYSPIPLYRQTTTWQAPALRLCAAPPLDVTAIDNLPSLLPLESSQDFAGALLPHLQALAHGAAPQWQRARATFDQNAAAALGATPPATVQ